MRKLYNRFYKYLCSIALDEQKRLKQQYFWVYLIVGCVSLFMSAVNALTGEYVLLISTVVFAAMCAVNMHIHACCKNKGPYTARALFAGELIALFLFFIISGVPQGFSSIWVCLLPTSGLFLFGKKNGSILCAIMFIVLAVCFGRRLGAGCCNTIIPPRLCCAFHCCT